MSCSHAAASFSQSLPGAPESFFLLVVARCCCFQIPRFFFVVFVSCERETEGKKKISQRENTSIGLEVIWNSYRKFSHPFLVEVSPRGFLASDRRLSPEPRQLPPLRPTTGMGAEGAPATAGRTGQRRWRNRWTMTRRECGAPTLSRASRRPWPSTRPVVDGRSSCLTRARCTAATS